MKRKTTRWETRSAKMSCKRGLGVHFEHDMKSRIRCYVKEGILLKLLARYALSNMRYSDLLQV